MQNEFVNIFINKLSYKNSKIFQEIKKLCIMKNKLLVQAMIDHIYEKKSHDYINRLLIFIDQYVDADMIDFIIKKNITRLSCLPEEIICVKYLPTINFFLSHNTEIIQVQNIFNKACINSETKIVELCIEKGATFSNNILKQISCFDNINIEFIKLLIDNNAIDLNDGFIRVCANSYINIEILELFVENGVTNLNDGFIKICQNRSVREELVKFFIDHNITNLNFGFTVICQNNNHINTHIIKLFIDNGVTNLNDAFIEICDNYYLSVALIKIFVDSGVTNLNDGFAIMCDNVYESTDIINDIVDFFLHNNIIDEDIIKNAEAIPNLSLEKKLKYGIVISFTELARLKNIDFLSVLCNHNFIMCHGKIFSLQNMLKIILMNFDSMISTSNNITFSFKKSEDRKMPLTIVELVDIYNEIPEKLITNSYKRELMQCYLDRQLWKPMYYNDFPSNIKKKIFAFVLIAKHFSINKIQCKIPKPLIHMIINLLIN